MSKKFGLILKDFNPLKFATSFIEIFLIHRGVRQATMVIEPLSFNLTFHLDMYSLPKESVYIYIGIPFQAMAGKSIKAKDLKSYLEFFLQWLPMGTFLPDVGYKKFDARVAVLPKLPIGWKKTIQKSSILNWNIAFSKYYLFRYRNILYENFNIISKYCPTANSSNVDTAITNMNNIASSSGSDSNNELYNINNNYNRNNILFNNNIVTTNVVKSSTGENRINLSNFLNMKKDHNFFQVRQFKRIYFLWRKNKRLTSYPVFRADHLTYYKCGSQKHFLEKPFVITSAWGHPNARSDFHPLHQHIFRFYIYFQDSNSSCEHISIIFYNKTFFNSNTSSLVRYLGISSYVKLSPLIK
ncbi:hypothetical protein H8356DRAFT_1327963 [Neocallimastix lanati (nom. inval.)]|nr:hypothetical protein H8356DRAFT_1327963 [Neocallimastix sp. JGI-2020a]